MGVEGLSDHEVWELLKAQDAEAWALAAKKAVLAELQSLRSGQKARDWGVSGEELLSMLYIEMVGRGKLELYRDDGGSLWGWMRSYVRGYVRRGRPDGRVASIEASEELAEEGRQTLMDKISREASEKGCGETLGMHEDPLMRRRERWELVQKCFGDLWKKNPRRAYVHLLKLRMGMSSAEIKRMLGASSEANVDQMFSRAAKDMRELKEQHERS